MKFATIVGYFPFRQTKQPETSGIIKRKWNDIFMHQSIPAAPSPPPPGLLWGICPPCQSRGWGICKCCAARGPGICQPRGQPRAFDMHAVSYQYNYTEDFTGKTSRLAHLSRTAKKLKRFVKACSRFYACIFSLLIKPELHGETWELSV